MSGADVPAAATNVIAAAVQGYGGCLVLRQDGSPDYLERRIHTTGKCHNVIAIGAGVDQCLAVQQNGTDCWMGRTIIMAKLHPHRQVPRTSLPYGADFWCLPYGMALRTDGIRGGIWNAPGIPANATNLIAIAPGDSHMDGVKSGWNRF